MQSALAISSLYSFYLLGSGRMVSTLFDCWEWCYELTFTKKEKGVPMKERSF
jgi:hypothetical protein